MDSYPPQMLPDKNIPAGHSNPHPTTTPGAYPPNPNPNPNVYYGPTIHNPSSDHSTYPITAQIHPVRIDVNSLTQGPDNIVYLEKYPVFIKCRYCGENMTTMVKKKIGCVAWFYFFFYLIFCPCLAWLVFKHDRYKNHNHYCTKCDKKVGVYYRL